MPTRLSILKLLIAFAFIGAQSVSAQTISPYSSEATGPATGISEYFFSQSGREVLRPIRLLSGVQKPGLYHVPDKTSLTSIIAISGGTLPDANTSEITVRRQDGSTSQKDLRKVLLSGDDLILQSGDMIFIPKKEGFFDQNTATTVIVLVSLLSVLISGYVASKAK